MDQYALRAWAAQVMIKAANQPLNGKYEHGIIDWNFMRSLAKHSWSESGPLLAREFLANYGIALVIERHLPRTRLDGAAIMISKDRPVVGLTIRYDRIDNFWFCLMHELAHIALHIEDEPATFYDDLDVPDQGDVKEQQADDFAGEALIPHEAWVNSPASSLRSPEAAESLARKLEISPAIVAGRMRHEFKAYRLLNNLVGHRKVRRLFTEVTWR
jgi:HTH-type transcriptional regulator/antitoxin HigA